MLTYKKILLFIREEIFVQPFHLRVLHWMNITIGRHSDNNFFFSSLCCVCFSNLKTQCFIHGEKIYIGNERAKNTRKNRFQWIATKAKERKSIYFLQEICCTSNNYEAENSTIWAYECLAVNYNSAEITIKIFHFTYICKKITKWREKYENLYCKLFQEKP